MPLHRGNVSEVGPGEYPTAATLFSTYAPTIDAQQRGASCKEALDQGDASKAWRWRVCSDPGWGKPLVLRGYAKHENARAFDRFATDERMRSAYARRDDFSPPPVLKGVELGRRREDRRLVTREMPLPKFLDEYKKGVQPPQQQPPPSNRASSSKRSSAVSSSSSAEHFLYAVSPLPTPMALDVTLPSFLRCGGAHKKLYSLNLWMSSGGTESVVHTDSYDNLNCVYSGSKRFFLMDSVYYSIISDKRCGWYNAEQAAKDAGDDKLPDVERRLKHGYGTFSGNLNVSSIDLKRFPCWANLPYYEATINRGDCLFIPQHWIHHVASSEESGRSVATNLWWFRPERFDPSDCVDRHPSTGKRIYEKDEAVPMADCKVQNWIDFTAAKTEYKFDPASGKVLPKDDPRKQPACVPGRRGEVVEDDEDIEKEEL